MKWVKINVLLKVPNGVSYLPWLMAVVVLPTSPRELAKELCLYRMRLQTFWGDSALGWTAVAVKSMGLSRRRRLRP